MKQRVKQVALTCALTLPLAVTAMMTGPFAATTSAQPGQRMVGPRFPVLIDTNGDGLPSPSDAPTGTQVTSSNTLVVSSPVTCDSQPNTTLTFSGSSGGRYTTISRTGGFRTQSLTVSGAGGSVSQLQYSERIGNTTTGQGTANLMDANRDGAVDTIAVSGEVNTMISLVFTPDSSYASIPASQAALIGARGRSCASIPQIWVPLADTNGDGRGDAVVFDLDGNGLRDDNLWNSPPLGAPGVPATNTFGLVLLTILLGAIAIWYLGQRRDDPATA
jgi:hypothetical protein